MNCLRFVPHAILQTWLHASHDANEILFLIKRMNKKPHFFTYALYFLNENYLPVLQYMQTRKWIDWDVFTSENIALNDKLGVPLRRDCPRFHFANYVYAYLCYENKFQMLDWICTHYKFRPGQCSKRPLTLDIYRILLKHHLITYSFQFWETLAVSSCIQTWQLFVVFLTAHKKELLFCFVCVCLAKNAIVAHFLWNACFFPTFFKPIAHLFSNLCRDKEFDLYFAFVNTIQQKTIFDIESSFYHACENGDLSTVVMLWTFCSGTIFHPCNFFTPMRSLVQWEATSILMPDCFLAAVCKKHLSILIFMYDIEHIVSNQTLSFPLNHPAFLQRYIYPFPNSNIVTYLEEKKLLH